MSLLARLAAVVGTSWVACEGGARRRTLPSAPALRQRVRRRGRRVSCLVVIGDSFEVAGRLPAMSPTLGTWRRRGIRETPSAGPPGFAGDRGVARAGRARLV